MSKLRLPDVLKLLELSDKAKKFDINKLPENSFSRDNADSLWGIRLDLVIGIIFVFQGGDNNPEVSGSSS